MPFMDGSYILSISGAAYARRSHALKHFQFLARFHRDDRLLPIRLFSRHPSDTLYFPLPVQYVHFFDFYFEHFFGRLLDFHLIGVRAHKDSDFPLRLPEFGQLLRQNRTKDDAVRFTSHAQSSWIRERSLLETRSVS